MPEPKVVKADVGKMPESMFDSMPKITVTFDDDSTKELFSYYPDEITFSESELIGKTEKEIRTLKRQKDVNYLRS